MFTVTTPPGYGPGTPGCINVSSGGPFGAGYDNFPEVLQGTSPSPYTFADGLTSIATAPRSITGGKTVWWTESNLFTVNFSNPCLWSASRMLYGGSNTFLTGYKPGQFTDGPLGNYYSNIDGTGNLMFTVT